MRCRFRLSLAAALFGLWVSAADPKPTAAEEAKAMAGTWEIVSAEVGGRKLPAEVLKAMSLTLADGKYTVKSAGPDDTGTVTLDPAKSPKAMDIKGEEGPNKGKAFPCVYELDGDTLTVCYDLSGKARPTEFKSPAGTQHFLAVYKRKKGK